MTALSSGYGHGKYIKAALPVHENQASTQLSVPDALPRVHPSKQEKTTKL